MSNVTVTIEGLPIGSNAITGATIRYGVNAIPVCFVSLDPTDSGVKQVTQDQQQWLREAAQITISVTADSGTTYTSNFSGLFDGFSFDIAYGQLSVTAVFKNQFQLLLESYSKLPGLAPMGVNPFQRISSMQIQPSVTNDVVTDYILFQGNTLKVSTDITILQFYLNIATEALTLQASGSWANQLGVVQPDGQTYTTLVKLMTSQIYQQKAQAALQLLQNIDLTYVNNINQSASCVNREFFIQTCLAYGSNSEILWENLVQYYNSFGCNLIVNNNKVFVIPNNGFITVSHNNSDGNPNVGGGIANIGAPSEYNHVTFNNNGYRAIGFVGVVAESAINGSAIGEIQMYKGGYADPNATSGGLVVIKEHPLLYIDTVSTIKPTLAATKLQQLPSGQPSYISQLVKYSPTPNSDPDAVTKAAGQISDQLLGAIANNYAQSRLYQFQYGDRTGQAILQYNTNWAPGASGAFYVNELGLWLDCYIDSVEHTVQQANGEALTSIGFSCGRLGVDNPSIPADLLFEYGTGEMSGYINAFISGT